MAQLQGMTAAEKRDKVLNLAYREGFKAATLCGALSTSAVYYFSKTSPRFNRVTNVSARVALAISPFFLMFPLRAELVMVGASENPRAYGIQFGERHTNDKTDEKIRMGLRMHHKAANWLYEHPYHLVVGLGVPAVGGILWSTRNEAHLKLSQKLMHTRVYGQMTVVGMLFVIMSFREYMKRNGGLFVEEVQDEVDEEEERQNSTVAVAS